jgi:hypothetical protein
MAWSKVHAEDPQIIVAIAQKLVAKATWRPRFVHPSSRSFFPTCFLTGGLHAFLFCPTRAACPVHLILLDIFIRNMLLRITIPSLFLLTVNCTEVFKLRIIHYEHIMNIQVWVSSLPLIDFHYWPPAVVPQWSPEAINCTRNDTGKPIYISYTTNPVMVLYTVAQSRLTHFRRQFCATRWGRGVGDWLCTPRKRWCHAMSKAVQR